MQRIFLIIFVLLLPIQGYSAEKKTIIWYHAGFSPGIILKGPMAGQGYHNVLEDYLRESMPEYEHVYKTANFGRIQKQIKNTDACCVCLIKNNEREEYTVFSQPTMVGMMNGVHILSEDLPKFKPFINDDGYISIVDIFNKSNLKVGIGKGRKFGPAVDKLLTKHKNSKRIITHYKGDIFQSLILNMESRRGIDYVIGYPQELQWLKSQKKTKGQFTFIPIKEMPKYVLSYVGCTKNAWGKGVITKVNKILKGQYQQEYKERYQEFIPAGTIKIHEKLIPEIFPITQQNELQ